MIRDLKVFAYLEHIIPTVQVRDTLWQFCTIMGILAACWMVAAAALMYWEAK
jgi:hypothetical protein